MDQKTKKTLDCYDAVAKRFGDSREGLIWEEFSLALNFVGDLKGGLDEIFVIDFGCGCGRFAKKFSKDKYLGIDGSKEMIKEAVLKNDGYEFLVGNVLDCKIDRKADLILAVALMQHLVSDEEWVLALKNMAEYMKVDARMIVTIWDLKKSKFDKDSEKGFVIIPFDGVGERYYRRIERDEFLSLANLAGLVLEKEFEGDNIVFVLKLA